MKLPWRTDYVINALNSVDALADALDGLLERCAYENMVNADTAIANAALAAYRGDK